PPSTDPDAGRTAISPGRVAVITSPPERMEVSAPLVTVRFFGPSVTESPIEMSILALVDATADIRSPKQFFVTTELHEPEGIPKTIPGAEVVNETPGTMASPPSVSTPLAPIGIRAPKAGRVRLSTVAFAGKA